MRVVATPVRPAELKPGELFSTASQPYWDARDPHAVGERVFIRTDAPAIFADDYDEARALPLYRITILPDQPQQPHQG